MSYGKCIYLGNITKKSEVKVTKGGSEWLAFSMAIETGYGDKSTTAFVDISAFGKNAVNIDKYFDKGSEIIVECHPTTSTYEKDGQKRSSRSDVVDKWGFTRGSKKVESAGVQNSEDADFMNLGNSDADELPFS